MAKNSLLLSGARALLAIECRLLDEFKTVGNHNFILNELNMRINSELIEARCLLVLRNTAHISQIIRSKVCLVLNVRSERNLCFFNLKREHIDELVERLSELRVCKLAVHRPQAVCEHR